MSAPEVDPIVVHQMLVWRAEAERSRLHRYAREARQARERDEATTASRLEQIARCGGCGDWRQLPPWGPRRCGVCGHTERNSRRVAA